MELYATIKQGQIIPAHDSDAEKLAKVSGDVMLKITVTKPRNYQFHKKAFALFNLAYQNQESFENFDHLREWLTMKAGYFDCIPTPGGEMFRPKSISYAAMDDLEFGEFYSKVLDVICWWLDTSKEDIQKELVNFM